MSSQSLYSKSVFSASKIEQRANSVPSNMDFHSLVQVVLRNGAFHIAPASSKASLHHYWEGDLAEYKEEVICIMLNVNETLAHPVWGIGVSSPTVNQPRENLSASNGIMISFLNWTTGVIVLGCKLNLFPVSLFVT